MIYAHVLIHYKLILLLPNLIISKFLAKMDKQVSVDILTKAAFGAKDMSDSIFDVWQSTFIKRDTSTILQSLIRERRREQDLHQISLPSPSNSSYVHFSIISLKYYKG